MAVFSVCQIASAEMVTNVDLNSSLTGAAADIGDFVGSFDGGTNVNVAIPADFTGSGGWLTDSEGVANSVSLKITGASSFAMDYGGPIRSALFTDGWKLDADDDVGSRTLTFGNLVAGGEYKLVFYSWANTNYAWAGVSHFNVNGSAQGPSGPYDTAEFYVNADAQGEIVATWYDPDTTDSMDAVFNGFQIMTVPEPATLGLLAMGGLAMLRRRKA